MNRRQLLARAAAVGLLPLAGCLGGGDGDADTPTPETTTAETTTTTTETTTTTTETTTIADTTTTTTTTTALALTISLEGTSFAPVRARVDTGATVRWRNESSLEHDVTAAQFHEGAADWDASVSMPPDSVYTETFEEPGVYEYYCTIHGEGTMCGAVIVGDASLDASLPCESGDGSDGDEGGGYGDDGGY